MDDVHGEETEVDLTILAPGSMHKSGGEIAGT